jgi:hypothetical protein
MTSLIGGECNVWLVLALLVLALGLAGALVAAARGGPVQTRRTR